MAASHVAVSQGYKASEQIPSAALVSLDPSVADSVVLASPETADNLVGVAVPVNDSLLSESASGSEVQVATSGTATALVSDVNGDVKQGDRISASPIKGVGMRSVDTARIVGVAQSNLSDASDKQSVQIQTKDGANKSVNVGKITVIVNVTNYSVPLGTVANYLPPVVQQISNTVAGKQVSPLRVVLSFILILIAILISVVLVYTAVRSSIISIGRNPLSQPAVRRSLFQVFGFVLLVLLVTLISVYLILTR